MSYSLVFGARQVGAYLRGTDDGGHLQIMDDGEVVVEAAGSELWKPELGALARYRTEVTKLQVAYTQCPDLEFLRLLPAIEEVWLQTPSIGSIEGLRHLPHLRTLGIDRPRYRFDVLAELKTLEAVYLDDWRPGADGVFLLPRLKKLSIQKQPYADLTRLQHMAELEELWLNAGKLHTLHGLPAGVRRLRLTSQRFLADIESVGTSMGLKDLRCQNCRVLASLRGLERCEQIDLLSLAQCGPLTSLEPIRNLLRLRYVVLADGTVDSTTGDVDALYTLPGLKNLIVSRQARLDPVRLRASAPDCDLRITAR